MGITVEIRRDIEPTEAWQLLNDIWPERAEALREVVEIGFSPRVIGAMIQGRGHSGWALLMERAAQHVAQDVTG